MPHFKFWFVTSVSFIGILFQPTRGFAEPVKIHKSVGNFKAFHHIEYTLTPINTRYPYGKDKYGLERSFGKGDWCIVFLDPQQFPITNPFKEWIKLSTGTAKAPVLCQEIKTMLDTKQGSVKVIIELDPYFNIAQQTLTQPNIWFRSAYGKYIGYVGQLKPEDRRP